MIRVLNEVPIWQLTRFEFCFDPSTVTMAVNDFDLPANFDLHFKTLIASFQNVTYALNNAIKSEYLVSGPSAPSTWTNPTPPLYTRRDRKRKRDNPEQHPSKKIKSGFKKKTWTVKVSEEIPARPTVICGQCSPDRAQTLDSVDRRVVSPYFRKQRTSRPRTVKKLAEPPVQLPTIEPPNEWWAMEPSPVMDSRSIAVIRANSKLYYNLWLAKPDLIQGLFLFLTLLFIYLSWSLQNKYPTIPGNY